MKNTILFSIIAIFMCLNASAQDDQQMSWGIQAGVNFQNINGTDPTGAKLSNSLVPRLVVGINDEIPIAPDFYIQPGLRFYGKGAKATFGTVTSTISLNYLELPIDLVFKPALGDNHIILGFGPYFGYAVGGKVKYSGTGAPAESKVTFASDLPSTTVPGTAYFKHGDIGADFFAGYEFANGFNIILNTQLGLVAINSSNSASKLSEKNTGFGITLGYRFLKK